MNIFKSKPLDNSSNKYKTNNNELNDINKIRVLNLNAYHDNYNITEENFEIF